MLSQTAKLISESSGAVQDVERETGTRSCKGLPRIGTTHARNHEKMGKFMDICQIEFVLSEVRGQGQPKII